jgi:hypothetical protein
VIIIDKMVGPSAVTLLFIMRNRYRKDVESARAQMEAARQRELHLRDVDGARGADVCADHVADPTTAKVCWLEPWQGQVRSLGFRRAGPCPASTCAGRPCGFRAPAGFDQGEQTRRVEANTPGRTGVSLTYTLCGWRSGWLRECAEPNARFRPSGGYSPIR